MGSKKFRHGTLEVHVIGARGLTGTDMFTLIDPYVIVKCNSQEKKSNVAQGQGTDATWNEFFHLTVCDDSHLFLKLMDSDGLTRDDFIGEAMIPLEKVLEMKTCQETTYCIIKDNNYCGEISVALNFTPENCTNWSIDLDESSCKE